MSLNIKRPYHSSRVLPWCHNKQFSTRSNTPNRSSRSISEFSTGTYERAFNLIYGTQIQLLQDLATKGTAGEAYTNLAIFYEEFRRRAADSTNYQMPDYVRFLHQLGFIEYFGEESNFRVRITPTGLGFLSYIRAEYPFFYEQKSL